MPEVLQSDYSNHYKINAKKGTLIKMDAKYNVVKEHCPGGFSGKFRSIDLKVGEFDGDPIYSLKLYFGEKLNTETLEVGVNNLGLSLVNSLLGYDGYLVGSDVFISAYKKEDSRVGNVLVVVNDDKEGTSWAYDYHDFKYMLDKEHEEFKNRWKKVCDELNSKINTNPTMDLDGSEPMSDTFKTEESSDSESLEEEDSLEEMLEDDLPF